MPAHKVPVSNSRVKIINELTRRLVAARAELKRKDRIIRRLEAGERRVLCSTCTCWAWRRADGSPPPDWGYAGQLVSGMEAFICPDCLALHQRGAA